MRQVVLALCLVAVTARANHLSLKVASGYTDVVGRDACLGSSKIVIDRPLAAPGVQEPGLATYAGYLRIVEEKEDTTCPTDTSGKKYTDAELRAGSTFTILVVDIAGSSCPNGVVSKKRVCVRIKETTAFNNQTTDHDAHLVLTYDSEAPARPAVTGTTAKDQRIEVSWSSGELKPSGYRLFWARAPPEASAGCPDPEPTLPLAEDDRPFLGTEGRGETTATLENNSPYYVWVTVEDEVGNRSVPSAVCVGIPRAVADFWSTYRRHGGKDTGGCGLSAPGASPPSLAALAAAAAAIAARRRRR